jgi:hypothetical protein
MIIAGKIKVKPLGPMLSQSASSQSQSVSQASGAQEYVKAAADDKLAKGIHNIRAQSNAITSESNINRMKT